MSVESSVVSSHTAYIAVDEEQDNPIEGAIQTWDLSATMTAHEEGWGYGGPVKSTVNAKYPAVRTCAQGKMRQGNARSPHGAAPPHLPWKMKRQHFWRVLLLQVCLSQMMMTSLTCP